MFIFLLLLGMDLIMVCFFVDVIITPPAVGEVFIFLFFSVSQVGAALMGDTAGHKLREPT